jgi:alpha-ketoglutarate-dependent taurine dioxygenase/acyl carrier protein
MTTALQFRVTRTAGRPAIVHAGAIDSIEAAADWLRAHQDDIRAVLTTDGALMIRGLPVASVEDFAIARDGLLAERVPYREKATPRSQYADGVFSSTDLPASQPIEQHNENSYTLDFPGLLLFGCLTAPETGGATPVADVRKVLAGLPEPLVRRFRERGWTLLRNYTENVGLPWQRAFGTTERADVEAYCDEHRIGYRWDDDGSLRTAQVRSAVVHHPVTGEQVWFNHAAFWNEWALDADVREVMFDAYGPGGLPFMTFDGAGDPLSETDHAALRDAYERATVRESWQPGDLLVVDNLLSSHGREAFSGPRRILVAMGDPVRIDDCRPVVAPRAFDPDLLGADPATRMLTVLGDIWCEVLGRPSVAPDANFFDLGGHSLHAMRVVNRLRETTGVRLSMRRFYESPVLRDLAEAARAV